MKLNMEITTREGITTKLECRNLTRKEEQYLQRQVYYFFPFLRVVYQFFTERTDSQFLLKQTIDGLKLLCQYYAGAFVFGEFDLEKEQQLIDKLFNQMGLTKDTIRKRLPVLRGNMFNATDGDPIEYFFGDRTCADLFNLTEQEFDMGVGGGLISLPAADRRKLLFGLGEHIKKDKKPDEELAVWGNVARGAIDAAAIDLVFRKIGLPSKFHLYRMSTQAYKDDNAFSLGEDINTNNTWCIGVDSMSAGGKSFPESINYLRELGYNRTSFFLTWCGDTQIKRYPVEYQWDEYPNNYVGTLFGSSKKV